MIDVNMLPDGERLVAVADSLDQLSRENTRLHDLNVEEQASNMALRQAGSKMADALKGIAALAYHESCTHSACGVRRRAAAALKLWHAASGNQTRTCDLCDKDVS